MKKQPEKTAQTRKNIIKAFWDLAKTNGIKQVTISEITRKANLNRGTFYVYFEDINDLLYQAEDEIIDDIQTKLKDNLNDSNFDIYFITKKATEIIGLYDDKLYLLLGKKGDPTFLNHIRHELSNIFLLAFANADNIPNKEFIIAYITSAFTGLLQYWYEQGKTISISELSELAYTLLLNGLNPHRNKY